MNAVCSTPDYKLLLFKPNTARPGIYDLVNDANFKKFRYFRLETPKADYLKKQGAKHLIEAWDKGIKILHSGLIPFDENLYFADYQNRQATGKRISLMIAKIYNAGILIIFFNGYNKKSQQMKIDFCRWFIKKMAETNHDSGLMFNLDNCQS